MGVRIGMSKRDVVYPPASNINTSSLGSPVAMVCPAVPAPTIYNKFIKTLSNKLH